MATASQEFGQLPPPASAAPRRLPVAARLDDRDDDQQNVRETVGFWSLLADLFDWMPAWMVSLVVHVVAILLLGLWSLELTEKRPNIVLAASVSEEELPGENSQSFETKIESAELHDFGAIELKNLVEQTGAAAESKVELASIDSTVQVPSPVGTGPQSPAESLVSAVPAPAGHMFAGRDPTVREHVVRREGGTSASEAAVAGALRFLARHQREDGSWSLEAFNRTPACDATCSEPGHVNSDESATAMALLPFLGAGQTHRKGEYAPQVFKGLKWLVDHQKEDGDLRGNGGGTMYAHGQAAIVLCEAYALSDDSQLRAPAQMALNFIIEAQHPEGGWRYRPGEAGDTSVVGWQLMALRSGQMAHLNVPARTFHLAGYYLDSAQSDKLGGHYGYQPGRRGSTAMTAEALLCREYLGWPKTHQGLQAGARYLLEHLPRSDRPNIYYWYYATQVLHHMGGKPWETWNPRMRQLLIETQEKNGHAAGSWSPERGWRGSPGGHVESGGRIYMTALAACILEVYYRHMPLYAKAAVEGK